MPHRLPRGRALLLLAALATGACGTSPIVPPGFHTASPGGSPAGTASPSASAGASASATPASTIAFGPCSGNGADLQGATCGDLQVPLDYSDASKGTIAIGVIRVPATDRARRIGSLLVNPGGPGASGVQFVEDDFSLFRSLNDRFDIVGFDPRGTAGKDAVSCETTEQLDQLVAVDPIIDDPGEKQQVIDTSKQLADLCRQHSGRLLPYVGTDNVIRDVDAIRAALGDAKLSYLGFSYGTDIGAHYAERYPDHVRALALDGDVDPSVGIFDQVQQQADGLEDNYREFLRRCTAGGQCPLGSDPGAAITKLLDDLDAHPVPVGGRTVGRGEALVALLASMYEPSVWDEVYILFGRAIRSGDVSGLQLLSDSYTGRHPTGYDHQMESGIAVDCVDNQVPTDIAQYDSTAKAVEARDPSFGYAAVYGVLPCAYWSVPGAPPHAVSVHGAPPILLVGATHDPATPYSWSQSLQRQIEGSVLLTRDGYGHTSYDASSCVSEKVDAYLEDLTVPGAGVTCPSD